MKRLITSLTLFFLATIMLFAQEVRHYDVRHEYKFGVEKSGQVLTGQAAFRALREAAWPDVKFATHIPVLVTLPPSLIWDAEQAKFIPNPAYNEARLYKEQQIQWYVYALKAEYPDRHFVLMARNPVDGWFVIDPPEYNNPQYLGFVKKTVKLPKWKAERTLVKYWGAP